MDERRLMRGAGRAWVVMVALLLAGGVLRAQDAPTPDAPPAEAVEAAPTPTPAPEPVVSVEADDGLALSGVYYDPGGDRPAVLLLHQMYAARGSWADVIQPLLDAGFKVLIVDLRGFGDTGGKLDWTAAQADTLTWAGWLRAQPGVTQVLMLGSSIGSSLALVGCAAAEGCGGAVALSPGLSYYRVDTSAAVAAGFPALIVYADRDFYPARDVPAMLELAAVDGDASHLTTLVYPGRAHGMDVLTAHDDALATIIGWLAER